MSLQDKIQEELNQAVKAKDETKVRTLRFVMAQIKDAQIEKRASLEDEEIVKILRKIEKQQAEAISLYEKGQRPDLIEKEEAERKIVRSFLPQLLKPEEIEKIVDAVIASQGKANFGQVMGEVMRQVGGRADGKIVSEIVSQKIKA